MAQLNRSFLRAALPHRNLEEKIRKNWQPSFSSTTFLYRNCCKNFGPVEPQFSSRSSPSPKLGRKDWQPSSSSTHFPLQELRRKIFLSNSVSPKFFSDRVPHRNLDAKIGSPVLRAQPSFTGIVSNFLVQFSPKFFLAQHSLTESWTENFLPQFSSHTASSLKLGWKIWSRPVLPAQTFFLLPQLPQTIWRSSAQVPHAAPPYTEAWRERLAAQFFAHNLLLQELLKNFWSS